MYITTVRICDEVRGPTTHITSSHCVQWLFLKTWWERCTQMCTIWLIDQINTLSFCQQFGSMNVCCGVCHSCLVSIEYVVGLTGYLDKIWCYWQKINYDTETEYYPSSPQSITNARTNDNDDLYFNHSTIFTIVLVCSSFAQKEGTHFFHSDGKTFTRNATSNNAEHLWFGSVIGKM